MTEMCDVLCLSPFSGLAATAAVRVSQHAGSADAPVIVSYVSNVDARIFKFQWIPLIHK